MDPDTGHCCSALCSACPSNDGRSLRQSLGRNTRRSNPSPSWCHVRNGGKSTAFSIRSRAPGCQIRTMDKPACFRKPAPRNAGNDGASQALYDIASETRATAFAARKILGVVRSSLAIVSVCARGSASEQNPGAFARRRGSAWRDSVVSLFAIPRLTRAGCESEACRDPPSANRTATRAISRKTCDTKPVPSKIRRTGTSDAPSPVPAQCNQSYLSPKLLTFAA